MIKSYDNDTALIYRTFAISHTDMEQWIMLVNNGYP